MSHHRRRLAVVSLAAGAALAGCGRSAGNPALDPGVVTNSPSTSTPSTSAPTALHPPGQRHEGTGHTWDRKHAENNGWKQRYELSPSQREIADAAATRLRPKLRRLRADGDFSREALRNALVESGLEPIDVVSDIDPSRERPPQALFWSTPRSGICVDGELTTDDVVIDTEGPSLDGGCKESGGGH